MYGVHRTRRDGSSFLWHQPCQRCKYTASVDIQKTRYKKLVTRVKSHAITFESAQKRGIKAMMMMIIIKTRGVARSLCLYQLITSTRKQWGELKDVCCTVGTDYSPLPLVRQQDTPLRALPGSSQCSSCAAAHEDRLPLHPPASQRLLQHMV